MNASERDVAMAVRSWLAEGPTDLPERVLDDVLAQLPLTGQRRRRSPREWLAGLGTPTRVGAAAAALVLAIVFVFGILPPTHQVVGPSASPEASPSPSASAEPAIAPEVDPAAYVRAAYEGLVDLPPLSVTVVEEEGTKTRFAYDGLGTVRLDHFGNANDSMPSELFLFTRDTRSELTELDGSPVWLAVPGQGHPLSELSGTLGLLRTCDTGWRYVSLERLLDRPVHHVACGESAMWLDVETRLPLRSVFVQGEDLPTITRDVTELRVESQPSELFQPPRDALLMSDAEFQCASDPSCASPAPRPTERPIVTPPPAPTALPVPDDLDALARAVLANLDAPPAMEMATGTDEGPSVWYTSDGAGRSRVDYGEPPSTTHMAEVLHANGHRYLAGRSDTLEDYGPTSRSTLPDWGLRSGCSGGWLYAGTDLVLDRPAHHLRCDRANVWIDPEWMLVTRYQRDPDILEYAGAAEEVLEVRLVQSDPRLFELPAGAGGRSGTAPQLTWRRVPLDDAASTVAWLGDRFVALDPVRGNAAVSPDGSSWTPLVDGDPERGYLEIVSDRGTTATWGDAMVHWDAGSVRTLVPPGGPAVRADFAGDIGALGIGPPGIVVRVHSGIDFDAFVTGFIGPDWVGQVARFEFVDGVLHIATEDGRRADIVMADEGLGAGDVADRGYGWFSEDGVTWVPIPDFPSNVMAIVGVADGFLARSDVMWHSPDGMTWQRIDGLPIGEGDLLPWSDGALEVGQTGEPLQWTSAGRRSLEVPSTALPLGGRGEPTKSTGLLGLVAVGVSDASYVAPDGAWSRGPMPDEMYLSGGGRERPRVVVGDEAVLVTLWSEAQVPSLWLGTLE